MRWASGEAASAFHLARVMFGTGEEVLRWARGRGAAGPASGAAGRRMRAGAQVICQQVRDSRPGLDWHWPPRLFCDSKVVDLFRTDCREAGAESGVAPAPAAGAAGRGDEAATAKGKA